MRFADKYDVKSEKKGEVQNATKVYEYDLAIRRMKWSCPDMENTGERTSS